MRHRKASRHDTFTEQWRRWACQTSEARTGTGERGRAKWSHFCTGWAVCAMARRRGSQIGRKERAFTGQSVRSRGAHGVQTKALRWGIYETNLYEYTMRYIVSWRWVEGRESRVVRFDRRCWAGQRAELLKNRWGVTACTTTAAFCGSFVFVRLLHALLVRQVSYH